MSIFSVKSTWALHWKFEIKECSSKKGNFQGKGSFVWGNINLDAILVLNTTFFSIYSYDNGLICPENFHIRDLGV